MTITFKAHACRFRSPVDIGATRRCTHSTNQPGQHAAKCRGTVITIVYKVTGFITVKWSGSPPLRIDAVFKNSLPYNVIGVFNKHYAVDIPTIYRRASDLLDKPTAGIAVRYNNLFGITGV
ncbi:hypothetical protein D3C75_859670 [compost metagenome]